MKAELKLRVLHLHDGNSTRHDRHNSKYMTIATLVDKDGAVCYAATARCNKCDTPSRKVGRELAIGRVMAQVRGVDVHI